MMSVENSINKQEEECLELKSIKYKTMLISGVPLRETKSTNNLINLERYLENEKNENENEPWCKLNKTNKIKKFIEFANIYKVENKLDNDENQNLIDFLKECLNTKKLQRVKDVVYDKTSGNIKEIPALNFIKLTKRFTLKNLEKRVSTLKSLGPKKVNHL